MKKKCIATYHDVDVMLSRTSRNWATNAAFLPFVFYVDAHVIFSRASRHDNLHKYFWVYLQRSTRNAISPQQAFRVWNGVKTMSHKRLRYAGPQRKTLSTVLCCCRHYGSCCFVCVLSIHWKFYTEFEVWECVCIAAFFFSAMIEECWMFPAGNNIISAHGLRNCSRAIDW